MNEKKLIISTKRYKGESSVVSTRLPNDLIKEVDKVVEGTGRTRNEILQMFIEFALENLEIK